jgi:hypothetical protein
VERLGRLDFEAMLAHAAEHPVSRWTWWGTVSAVGRGAGAVGGPGTHVVMVGAQFAYWRDYAADQRWQLSANGMW